MYTALNANRYLPKLLAKSSSCTATVCFRSVLGIHVQKCVLWHWLGFREENKKFDHWEIFSSNYRIRELILRWEWPWGNIERWLTMEHWGWGLFFGWQVSSQTPDSPPRVPHSMPTGAGLAKQVEGPAWEQSSSISISLGLLCRAYPVSKDHPILKKRQESRSSTYLHILKWGRGSVGPQGCQLHLWCRKQAGTQDKCRKFWLAIWIKPG